MFRSRVFFLCSRVVGGGFNGVVFSSAERKSLNLGSCCHASCLCSEFSAFASGQGGKGVSCSVLLGVSDGDFVSHVFL